MKLDGLGNRTNPVEEEEEEKSRIRVPQD